MKNLLIILICIGMLSMIACQNQTNNNHSEIPSSSQESSVLPESVSSMPQTDSGLSESSLSNSEKQEIGDKEISIPIKIIDSTAVPKVYDFGNPKKLLGTEKEIKMYSEWINSLDYENITDIYASTAYMMSGKTGTMSIEDTKTVMDTIKLVTEHLKPMTEEKAKNPYTGGGWTVIVNTNDTKVQFRFNGGWFIVTMDGQEYYWIFDVDKTPAQDLCKKISVLLDEEVRKIEGDTTPIIYKDSKISRLYAVDTNNCIMVEITEKPQIQTLVTEFNTVMDENKNLSGFGYLIFADNDKKEYIYLSEDDVNLNGSCEETLKSGKLHPSWLIHFNPKRVVDANGVKDKDKLDKLANFLKEEVTVSKEASVSKGSVNPNLSMGEFRLNMEFDSGVKYQILGTDNFDGTGTLSLYTSDLDTSVSYKLDNGVAQKITAFLKDFS